MTDPQPQKICPHCGALCNPQALSCWLCRSSLDGNPNIVLAQIVDPPPSPLSEWFFGISTGLVALLIVLVGIGVAQDNPGGGIMYAMVVLPAFLATVIRSVLRKQTHGRVTWAQRFTTLILSLSIIGGILTLLAGALVFALWIMCLQGLNKMH